MKIKTKQQEKQTIKRIIQSLLVKKTLFAFFMVICILTGFFGCLVSQTASAKQADPPIVYKELRKYYSSPTKSLNNILNQTSKTRQGMPTYSLIKGKSYINGKYSDTTPGSANKNSKKDVFDWLSDEGKYSRFTNDPNYSKNVQVDRSTPTKYSYDNINTSITTLKINNKISYDFEVIVWPDGTTSVPIKTLAELLDTQVEVNHVNNNISFRQPGSDEQVNINYQENKISVGANLIEVRNPKLVFIKEGFLVKDDIFVPEQIARDLLDVKSSFINEKCVVDLSTSRVLKAIIQLDETENNTSKFVVEEPLTKINEAEKENKMFKIKQINYNIGSTMNQTNASGNVSGTSTVNANGNFLGGEFNIGANTNVGQNGMQISGYRASLDYIKPKYELSLGATSASLSELSMNGGSLWGIRLGSVGTSGGSSVPRILQGKADDNTIVELFINDITTEKQPVKNGRYQFDSLTYSGGGLVHIRIDQITQNGERKVIYDRKFSRDSELLAPGQKQFMLFSGVDSTALTNNLSIFGDQFNYSYTQPVKWISGAKFRMGVTEQLTLGVNYARDFIIRQPSRLFLNNIRTLTSARTYRTGRSSSGNIISVDMDYAATKNLRIESELGYSTSVASVDPLFDPNGSDFGGFISFNYTKPNYTLTGKAFSYGPDFYSPGSNGLIDRRGGEISGSYKFGGINFSGGITKYNSNLDNYFIGGTSSVFNYNLYASGKIDEYSTLRAGVRSMSATNSLYMDQDLTYDLTIDRKINEKANLRLNYSRNIQKTKTPGNVQVTQRANNLINADLTYNAGKLGIVHLAHEMMMLDPVQTLMLAEINQVNFQQPVYSKNIRLSLDRSGLPIKGFTFSPNVGYRYGGDNKGLNFGLNMGYIFRQGRQIMVSYAYNSSFAKFFPGAFSFGNNRSHSLSFNFTDSLGFGSYKNGKTVNTFQSPFDNETGIIKGCVFIDRNQNGIKDPGEEGVSGIDISFPTLFDVQTDKEGNFIAANIHAGLRKVTINKDTLPVIYTPTVADALVNVKKERVYAVNFGVIPTPGSISGKVEVNSNEPINDSIIVLLLDKTGKEVKYTTTDTSGKYSINSIAPGEYIVVIDKNFLDVKKLQTVKTPTEKITIPFVTDDFIDIKDINFMLTSKKGVIK